MKPERIQFAPWFKAWQTSVPYLSKAYACHDAEDAVAHLSLVHRVARTCSESVVKTTLSEDNVVTIYIESATAEPMSQTQTNLGQRIDEALAYLVEAPVFENKIVS